MRVETIEKPVERVVTRVRYETKQVPATPAEAAKMVLTSPRACRHVLEGLAAKAEAGELDRGAHSSTLRAAEKLYKALTRKSLLRDRWLW